ncbi:MAG: LPS assembly protein LptD [bacterium]|nr:LPS assembly protein LptD [bacterium]
MACLITGPVAAQQVDRARLEDPLEITADRIDYDGERDLYVATGNVHVIQTTRTLRADWVAFSTQTQTGVAEGDVELVDESDVLRAEFMVFDVETLRGMFFDGGFDAGSQGFRIRAKEMIRTGENTFEMRDAVFTTCRCEPGEPLPWKIRTADADVEVGDYGTVRNATFDVLGVPVLWFPWAFFPVKSDRESGVLLPQLVLGGRSGFGGGLPLFWAAHDQVNVTFTPNYFSERGFKGDGQIEYVFGERSGGDLFVSGLYDQRDDDVASTDSRRFGVRWLHDQMLPGEWRWNTDLKYVSDNFYPEDFAEFRPFREFRFLESTTNVHRSFGDAGGLGAMVGARFADDVQGIRRRDTVPPGEVQLLDADDVTLQRFGEAAVDVQPGTAVAPGGIEFLLDADVVHFRSIRDHESVYDPRPGANPSVADGHFYDLGADGLVPATVSGRPFDFGGGNGLFEPGEPIRERGVRAVIHPRVARRFHLGRFGAVTPEVGWRQSLYRTDQQQFGERGLLTARLEWRNPLAREFERGRGGLLRHVVEPRLGWALVSQRQQDRNPLFTPRGLVEQSRLRSLSLEAITRDPADRIETANRVVAAVGQRFYQKRRARASLQFLGEVLTGIDYDFAEGGLGNVFLDGRMMPLRGFSARAVAAFDPEALALDEGGLDLRFGKKVDLWLLRRFTLVGGYRYRRRIPPVLESDRGVVRIGEIDAINQIRGQAIVELTSRIRLRYATVYKLAERDEFIRNSGTFEYVSKCRCWSVGATVAVDRRDNLRGGLMFRFIGLGEGREDQLFDSGFGTGVSF